MDWIDETGLVNSENKARKTSESAVTENQLGEDQAITDDKDASVSDVTRKLDEVHVNVDSKTTSPDMQPTGSLEYFPISFN